MNTSVIISGLKGPGKLIQVSDVHGKQQSAFSKKNQDKSKLSPSIAHGPSLSVRISDSELGDVSFESKTNKDNFDQVGVRSLMNMYHFDVYNLISNYMKKISSYASSTREQIIQNKNVLSI